MSFESFKSRVIELVAKTKADVSFSHEDGKHIAKCSDGVKITGNTLSKRVYVNWGSGHGAYAEI